MAVRRFMGAATVLLLAGVFPAQAATTTTSVSGAAIAWGNNNSGELGNDSRTDRSAPVQVYGLTSQVAAVSAGSGHSLALKPDGSVLAWGWNGAYQLGDGSRVSRSIPGPVSGLNSGVSAVAAGYLHNLALKSDGSVVGWGYNGYGQVGDGGPFGDVFTPLPVQVVGLTSGVVAVSAGEGHSLALRSDGSVVAWGWNAWGQLGDGTTTDRHTPVPVTGLTSGVVAIAAGGAMSYALKNTGAVVAWGDNTYGELGDGTTNGSRVPVQVSGLTSGVSSIAAGRLHGLAVRSDGSAVGWGYNAWGQVGDNSLVNRLAPVPISGLGSGVAAVAAGSVFSLALYTDGAVAGWGANHVGQVGDGTTSTNRLVPTQVVGQTSGNMAIAGGGEHALAVSTTPLPPDPPQPTVSIENGGVDEGTSGTPNKATTVLKFKVRLSASSTFPVEVTVTTSPGTAQSTAPKDFVARAQTLRIPAGKRTAMVKIKVYPDATVEPNETLTVTLSYPNNADLGDSQATGTIRNDD